MHAPALSFMRFVLLLPVALALCGAASAEPPPIGAFFKEPTFQSPTLSPNGDHIAVIYSDAGKQLILVRDQASGELLPIVSFTNPEFRLNRLGWASDDRLLISGVRRWQWGVGIRARATNLYGVDRDGENLRYLAKRWPQSEYIQFQDQILHLLPKDPKYVLIQVRIPGKDGPAVHRMDVNSGHLKRLVKGRRDIQHWYADPDGAVRLGYGTDSPDYVVVARASAKGDFETIAKYHATEGSGLDVLGFTKEADKVLVAARRPREGDPEGDRSAVYEYSIESKEIGRLVIGHDVVDVQGPLLSRPGTNEPAAIEYWVDGRELHYLDPVFEALQRGIDKALPDRINEIIGEAKDGAILLVRSSAPSIPPEVYVIHREQGAATWLLSEYPELEGIPLGTTRPIEYRAKDGLLIHGYLTLPPGSSGRNLPAILMPHGGPMARDYLAFDREVLFLASRGYAVLRMNFRGSSGYGYAHLESGFKRWGLEMQDDISDAAAWLAGQGIADPKRLAIYGKSYGGYAALMGAVKTPDLFRCAASYAGVFDLIAENKHDKRYGGGDIVEAYRGDDKKQLKAASPARHAERIRIPVLLGHGRDDPNVHVSQSKKMAKALRKAGGDVELALYDHEIHGFSQEDAALDFARRLEAFFAKHLAVEEGEATAALVAEPLTP